MKKNLVYAMMSAIALTSAVSFTGCASDDSASVDTNPTYDGNNVRTDFAFSISSGKMGGTRMTAVNTLQADNSFLGIKDMYLFPFSLGKTGDVLNVPANNTSTNISNGTGETAGKNFPLGSLTGITDAQSSKVYSLQLPVGTDNFLFYGTVDNSSVTEYTKRGALTSTLTNTTGNTDDISFSLVNIHSDLNKDLDGNTTNDAKHIADLLSYIAQAEVKSAADASVTIHWYEAPSKATNDGNYSTLATLYNKFITIGNNEIRTGSSEAVLRTVLDLYVTAKAIVSSVNDGDVKNLADNICERIKSGKMDNSVQSSSKVVIDETTNTDPAQWTASWNDDDFKPNEKFPHNLLLPMGAAQLEYNTTSHTFSYKTSPIYAVYGDPEETVSGVALGSISYPAELIYFDNSPLRATDKYKTVDNYPKTVADWDKGPSVEGGFSSDWSGTRVEPSTRAVAMQNNVNYGVALLEAKVQMAAGTASNMIDNMKALNSFATNNQTDIDGTKFTLTGILIGGQPKSVGWDMTNPGLPTVDDNTNNKDVFDQVIYDQDITFTTAIPVATSTTENNYSAPNYTLVLDNYTSGGTQKPVRFALELVNGSGKDFYGKDGMIPAGHTFYLCGELNPSGASYTPASRGSGTDYRVTQEATPRVFVQDYKTIANITISDDALQKAYSSIPDLRATEVLFGLSVDLKWEAGITFNVEL